MVTSALHLTWDDLLSAIVNQGEVVAGEEVSNFCSLLMVADRVIVASEPEHTAPARLLALFLVDLGFDVRIADCVQYRECEGLRRLRAGDVVRPKWCVCSGEHRDGDDAGVCHELTLGAGAEATSRRS